VLYNGQKFINGEDITLGGNLKVLILPEKEERLLLKIKIKNKKIDATHG